MVISIWFSADPVPGFQCFFFGRRSAYKNPHPYPVQRILPHGYYAYGQFAAQYANYWNGARSQMAAYSSSAAGNFRFNAGWMILSSNKTNHQGIGCMGTAQNWLLWIKSTRRMPVTKVLVLQTWRNAIDEMTGEERSLTVKISYPR